ncbi:DNA repair exonuclease SbcCD ATPase subunit [Sphingomonas sp. PP-CE-1A-559]|uniref:AAA family ATPase n=1 Tax=Sphingomonas sp. PP-CE-1A-559 TaxID=2135657 RepID=UPI001054A23A|nr:AAA family ATPase [Sphingomonas sp. PP-CE-1A-559]TCP85022.1 DNA repair exonuclease SbcCD ATPase subunit [Sphingomonas sp. PP-CE-1A-559]
MSLKIRRIALSNFRKFRDPFVLDGLTDGLNVIIEPNETGKSTLLEAMRAAFFIRHNTANRLARSYAPHGEAVAPQIEIGFEARGEEWQVNKRFLKGASVEVRGPNGRAQGEDAEAQLQALLGARRDTSQAGDAAAHGALGLLWVGQAQALEVTAPGDIVRDSVRTTLEAEVGTIMGGAAYQRVRPRIDSQFADYWTTTGRPSGRQTTARTEHDAAESAATEAATRLAALEQGFSDLEAARARLKVLDRDLADTTDADRRKVLVGQIDVARSAAQLRDTRLAEQGRLADQVKGLEDLTARLTDARKAVTDTAAALSKAREKRSGLEEELTSTRERAGTARDRLATARDNRRKAHAGLEGATKLVAARARHVEIARVRHRHAELLPLEAELQAARELGATVIPPSVIKTLEERERGVDKARAAVEAGATRIEFAGDVSGVRIDGMPAEPGDRTLSRETRIQFDGAELIIRPPAGLQSAETALANARDDLGAALTDHGVTSVADARSRNEVARDAVANVRTLEARIVGITPAVPLLGIAAGASALKTFITGLPESAEGEGGEEPDVNALTVIAAEADSALARAEGVDEVASAQLRELEARNAPLMVQAAGAERDAANAVAQLAALEGKPEVARLDEALLEARQREAAALVSLQDAERAATAHDVAAIERQIGVLDKRVEVARTQRIDLEKAVAGLEARIEAEGGKGLADRAAAAREEADAAAANLARVTQEAETLKLLRDTLEGARAETSRTFVGPVARRARRHIERLLPGCDPSFGDDLGLTSITRGGLGEICGDLSRGTQEQLAVLTRLAFADMLLEQGVPVSLILDDPLVYSDDARLDLMTEILTDAATRMQVILLTCRDRAFRHLGNRINLIGAQ